MSLRTVAVVGWICLALDALVVVAIFVTRNSGISGARLSTEVAALLGGLALLMAAGLALAQRSGAAAAVATAAVQRLVADGTLDLAAPDARGTTVLRHAILRATGTLPHAAEAVHAVRILTDAGARVDAEQFAAVASFGDDASLPLLDALLAAGADPDTRAPFTDEPLVFAADITPARLALLARHGADLHRPNPANDRRTGGPH